MVTVSILIVVVVAVVVVGVVVVAVVIVAVVVAVVAVARRNWDIKMEKMAIYNNKQQQMMVIFDFDYCC